MSMQVPIIVLNWNGWDDTFRCLGSLRAAGEGAPVWLVDNGSREDRTGEAAARFPGVRCLRWDQNLGYAGGNNGALRLAAEEGASWAYLLNNDCEVEPGFLTRALEVPEVHERIGAVGSVVVYGDRPDCVQYDGIGHHVGTTPYRPAGGSWPADYAMGAGMLMSLEACREVGYFDERFFCYHEEIEWCHRLRRAGWAIRVAGESRVRHHTSGSDTGANALYYRVRNEFLLEACLGSDPRRTRRRLIYKGVVLAQRERAVEQRLAIAQGLWDGLHGRVGPRRSPPPAARLLPLLAWWTFRAHLHDKVRAVRGLRPGWQ